MLEMTLSPAVSYTDSDLCRTIWLQLLFSLPVLSLLCEACKKVIFNVPPKLEAGMFVGRVNMKQCLKHNGFIRSNNPNFKILEDGSLYATNTIFLSSIESTITILLNGMQEHEQKKIHVSLVTNPKKLLRAKARHRRENVLQRTKRRWAPVPTLITENSLGPFPMQIQQLASDTAQKYNIRYSISGPGVDKPPLNLFYVEKETGNLFVTCPIDREEYPEFQIICYATTPDGYTPETPLLHIVKIDDENDNAPQFDHDIYLFHVLENSRVGTLVGQVIATDRDEPNTLHTQVKFRILSEDLQTYHSSGTFAIHPDSGFITVASADLDRETASEYTLKIEARDLGGDEFGLCSTALVVVSIGDVNDNIPQLVQNVYEVEIFENTENIELLRIPIKDNDESGTPSWLTTFTIIKGNEDDTFSITVDREMNVGVLCTLKGLDYEKARERRLEIVVNNEAPYDLASNVRGLSMNTATVIVKIRDQDEGPLFEPCEYILHIKECLPRGTVVGNYQARDPETENSEGMSYRIINDFCNWITIGHSGQLRTTKMLDRDALNMEDSPCNVTVRATDRSGKTGIGKIVIYLVDENDNYPVITGKYYIMCEDKAPIFITAFDADLPPYSVPFHFDIETPVSSSWRIIPHDDESALLSLEEDINYGNYTIILKIFDNEGYSGINEITLRYCNCVIPNECFEPNPSILVEGVPMEIPVASRPMQETSGAAFGIWPIAGTVIGSLLLLTGLITPIHHLVRRRKATVAPEARDDPTFENIILSNAEAPEEELTHLDKPPVEMMNAAVSMMTLREKIESQEGLEVIKGEGRLTPDLAKGERSHMAQSLLSLRKSHKDLTAEWQNFTNPHLVEKVFLCGQVEENETAEEYVLPYYYEGKGSSVGSLSSCIGESEEAAALDFLNNLEPSFKILAETCVKKGTILTHLSSPGVRAVMANLLETECPNCNPKPTYLSQSTNMAI